MTMVETQGEAAAAAANGRWRTFYERLRVDMIEAQCALESGRFMRASELIEGVMRAARRMNRPKAGSYVIPTKEESQFYGRDIQRRSDKQAK